MNKSPKVSLVGAGPGDPELLTIKAVKALKTADAILYDALANEAILKLAPAHAIRLFVGKRSGYKRFKQEEINLKIVQHAFAYGHVVRLKGGDPFVFGRGYEELDYIKAFSIPVEVIPGISSPIALPALQNVPVTSRGYSQSFWVMTGTTQTGQLSEDVQLAARSTATVIILMGIRKIHEIVHLFKLNNRGSTPVMVIQNGSRVNEKFVIGTIDSIEEKIKTHQIGTPGIIVIGQTVSLHEKWPEIKEQFVNVSTTV